MCLPNLNAVCLQQHILQERHNRQRVWAMYTSQLQQVVDAYRTRRADVGVSILLQIGSAILVIFLLIIQFIAMIWCVSASSLRLKWQLASQHNCSIPDSGAW
jgi:penicillin-binding protein-related factor A (putative recombinase)